ncbi:DNA mismatch repair protein MutS [Peptostreptococcus faecalis]|uniref:DNA mismatch repair protein MutS n=1 Tax=Peptostreptococcus faecalis TaxID=2045015 RepID=UPI000C7BBD29|nr:DNA mismatch repair protein MutS [Peptostreptococcus faecalis]
MKIDKDKLSPMMRKYIDTKEEHSDCILFYRLGDFYEMFFDDALLASKVLDIALTGKACGLEERAPMCGVPYHSASSYINKLIESGYKVAIAEQVEDPATTKGLVKREVVKVVTPGTLIEDDSLENTKNNYLMSIFISDEGSAVSYVDISTGELSVTNIDIKKIKDEIAKISPSEIIVNKTSFIDEIKSLSEMANIYINENIDEKILEKEVLYTVFSSEYLLDLGIKDDKALETSLSMVLNYIKSTQMKNSTNLSRINVYNSNDYMILDPFTRANLELTKTLRSSKKKGSLLQVLDATSTPMGARMLRKFIEQPLTNKNSIEYRLNITNDIKENFILREELKDSLSKIFDLERICAKIAYDSVSPKDLINLKNSIRSIPHIIEIIDGSESIILKNFIENIDTLSDIYLKIEESILEEPSMNIKEGNIIKSEYSEDLKDLRDISENGSSIIKEIEKKERERTGAKTLKIGYNKVFGYYLEITKAALLQANISDEYIRKQTLVNAERFITPELKEIEDKIINAQDKIKEIEYEIFKTIRIFIYENLERIQRVASIIAEMDVYVSNAIIANKYNYVKPNINTNGTLDIKDGRHPVIEQIMGNENFISNDIFINQNNIVNIITGPNMSGKSTYMRQVALISLMAHIGTFVPASYADIPVMDRIFTRVGASDDLSQGQSTFMVEMDEVSQILRYATKNSLIILDEIGRGTSTYDGISLAWSIAEYIHDSINAKTLFATHYHELTELESKYDNIKNYSIEVKEDGDNIVFLRKIIPVAADRSYGIYVAKLAKLPQKVLKRAGDILSDLEKNHIYNATSLCNLNDANEVKEDSGIEEDVIINNNEVIIENNEKNLEIKENEKYKTLVDELVSVDIMNSTPMDMMNALYNLQKKAKDIIE